MCVCSKIFLCVFKVFFVCVQSYICVFKVNCKFSGIRFFEVSLVFVGELEIRTSHLEVFCKLVFLTFFENSYNSTCAGVFFLIKLQATG